jgi:hypothetical protein
VNAAEGGEDFFVCEEPEWIEIAADGAGEEGWICDCSQHLHQIKK